MSAEAWAAWVQAIGSIIAIVAGFGTLGYQNWRNDRLGETERKNRAEVVVLRLDERLIDIGKRIETALDFNRTIRAGAIFCRCPALPTI